MNNEIKTTRNWIRFFIIILIVSGLTAMPVEQELDFLCRVFPTGSLLGNWLDRVFTGVHQMNSDYPFLAYGYDWLAFAHFVMAVLFIGPLKDPVKNRWVIEFGIIACLLIIPFALLAGHFRGIPFWWRMVDCSFGLIGLLPLGICLKKIRILEKQVQETAYNEKSI
ncbi:MAG: hypothetical protein ABIT05_09325 [Chitinophagaceae bacterium]